MLAAIRIPGAGVVAALGQLLVDMPNGYFGAVEHTTLVGLVYAASMFVTMSACGIGALLGWRPIRYLFPMLLLVGTAFFLPALANDLVVAAAVVGWQLGTLSQVVFEAAPIRRRGQPRVTDSPYRRPIAHLLILSIFASGLVLGLELTEVLTSSLACLVLDVVALVAAYAVLPWSRALERFTLIAVPIVILAVAFGGGLIPILGALLFTQLGILGVALVEGPLAAELVRRFIERPAVLVISTFAALAIVGAMALSLPVSAEGPRVSPLDALFTSMSATCVTGLVVLDTPTAFASFGEVVVLVLSQIGGLGIMVLSTAGTVMLGGRLTLKGERALEHVLDLGTPGSAYRLVRFIVVSTLGIELVGAVILTVCYRRAGFDIDVAAWRGVFHAVSAFCQSGFALQSNSIALFRDDPVALTTHGVLIFLGSLGFVVLAWIWSRLRTRTRSRASVQVRVVLWLSAFLIVLGMLAFAVLEWNNTLAGLSVGDKLINALFQSVTTRSGGLTTVDISNARPATLLIVMMLMFIGGAPGGTGGGIKVTTVAVLAAAIPEIVGSRPGAMLFGREVPVSTLQRAATIAVVSAGAIGLTLFLLLLTEDAPFVALAFEAVSAFGTVGLSLGVTPDLSSIGKWVLIVAMFVGRVGPLTLALALGERTGPRVHYPETRIMVG